MLPINNWANEPEIDSEEMTQKILDEVEKRLAEKNENIPENIVKMVEKSILLQVLDQLWKDHIATLDMMRHTIVLRAYGQKDPLNEYKREAFNMFSNMLDALKEQVTIVVCRTLIRSNAEESMQRAEQRQQNVKMQAVHEQPQNLVGGSQAPQNPPAEQENRAEPFRYGNKEVNPNDPSSWGKVARNDPCPCGSGKKYKHCHGRIE